MSKYNTYHFDDETHPHLMRYSQASESVSEESKDVSSKTQELQSTRLNVPNWNCLYAMTLLTMAV